MPNHLHLLIEIKESQPKYNFSTKRIIQNATDVEIINAFLNFPKSIFHKETHCSASQQGINNLNEQTHCSASPHGFENINEETHCSASPQGNNNLNEETHCSASLHGFENINKETRRSASPHGFENINKETHCSASPQGNNNNIDEETRRIASQQEKKSNNDKTQREIMEKFKRKPKSISSFVAQLKSKISKQINELENTKDSIWQSNYHDSIIKSPEMFKKVYFYIQNNPKNWEKDSLKKQ